MVKIKIYVLCYIIIVFRNRRIRIGDAIATIAIECDDSRANFGGHGVRPFLRSVGRTDRNGKNIPASSHVCRKIGGVGRKGRSGKNIPASHVCRN